MERKNLTGAGTTSRLWSPASHFLPSMQLLQDNNVGVSRSREESLASTARNSPPLSPRPSISEHMNLSAWSRNRPPSVHSRTSRASSVRSTRTGVSITTIQDDARSIDLSIGGQSFRITRDGSRILTEDQDYLPPYSTTLAHVQEEDLDDDASSTWTAYPGESSTETDTEGDSTANSQVLSQQFTPPSSQDSELAPTRQRSRSDALGHLSSSSLGVSEGGLHRSLSSRSPKDVERKPSFVAGPETISVDKRRSVSDGDVMRLQLESMGTARVPPLKRRNGIRLPKLVVGAGASTSATHGSNALTIESRASPASSRETQSAGPTFSSGARRGNTEEDNVPTPSSPSFIGRNASGIFPPPMIVLDRGESSTTDELTRLTPTAAGYTLHSPVQIEEGFAESHTPPAMDSENDISIHYTRMIRSIDRDYRKALHERDTELAGLRIRLDEKDTVYRQQLRARDFQIDDLKLRIAHLEEDVQRKLEKARNEVEDLWESRWKDRDHHLVERMRRIEMDSQKLVERAVAERDKEWAAEWKEKQGHLVDRLRIAERNGSH
ncbi:MAG: hypothetical protein Q9227_000886 [Pyrenula ochraceoflavens]